MKVNGKKIFLYMNFFRNDDSIGITKKIKSQICTMKKMGLNVTYTSYEQNGVVIIDNNENIVYRKQFLLNNETFKRFNRRFLLIKTVTEYFKSTGVHFDLAYLRWHTFDKPYLHMLKAIKNSGATCIIEAHAWTPNMVAKSLIAKYQVAMDNRYSKYAKNYVSLVAGMSEYDNIWGIKTVKVDNAVDLNNITERHWKRCDDIVRIVSVSNEYAYHGYDRLLRGIRNYYDNGGTRKIEVHFVGIFLDTTKALTEELSLSEIVYFHGKKFGKELDEIYDNSDIGIGALAHHRVGMYAGSSLKTKEYFAKGLPFIYGWKEPAFDETYPYALRVKLCEEPIDIDEVLSFYDSIKDDPNMLSKMRQFAADHYSWEKEISKVFDAL